MARTTLVRYHWLLAAIAMLYCVSFAQAAAVTPIPTELKSDSSDPTSGQNRKPDVASERDRVQWWEQQFLLVFITASLTACITYYFAKRQERKGKEEKTEKIFADNARIRDQFALFEHDMNALKATAVETDLNSVQIREIQTRLDTGTRDRWRGILLSVYRRKLLRDSLAASRREEGAQLHLIDALVILLALEGETDVSRREGRIRELVKLDPTLVQDLLGAILGDTELIKYHADEICYINILLNDVRPKVIVP